MIGAFNALDGCQALFILGDRILLIKRKLMCDITDTDRLFSLLFWFRLVSEPLLQKGPQRPSASAWIDSLMRFLSSETRSLSSRLAPNLKEKLWRKYKQMANTSSEHSNAATTLPENFSPALACWCIFRYRSSYFIHYSICSS